MNSPPRYLTKCMSPFRAARRSRGSTIRRIGLDTLIEALRFYRERGDVKVADLMGYASACRVVKVMRPYLEAIL
jgi:hypothetical protein